MTRAAWRKFLGSKGELELQVDAAIGARGGKGAAGEGVGLAEKWGSENAVGRSEIDDVEDVARGNAEGEIVRAIRSAAHAEWASATGTVNVFNIVNLATPN